MGGASTYGHPKVPEALLVPGSFLGPAWEEVGSVASICCLGPSYPGLPPQLPCPKPG